MKIEYKIFRVFFFSASAFPFLLFGYLLSKTEYEEHFLFGTIELASIKEIIPYSDPGIAGGNLTYIVKPLKMNNNIQSVYKIIIPTNGGVNMASNDQLFAKNVKVGDTVKVKILSDQQAKVLFANGVEINPYINFWGKFWKWILILVLAMIGLFILYKLYTTLKTKTTYE